MARYDPDDPLLAYLAIDRKMTLDDQSRPYDGKKACFVPDNKEGFATADIISSKGDEITVQTGSGEVRLFNCSLLIYYKYIFGSIHTFVAQFYYPKVSLRDNNF